MVKQSDVLIYGGLGLAVMLSAGYLFGRIRGPGAGGGFAGSVGGGASDLIGDVLGDVALGVSESVVSAVGEALGEITKGLAKGTAQGASNVVEGFGRETAREIVEATGSNALASGFYKPNAFRSSATSPIAPQDSITLIPVEKTGQAARAFQQTELAKGITLMSRESPAFAKPVEQGGIPGSRPRGGPGPGGLVATLSGMALSYSVTGSDLLAPHIYGVDLVNNGEYIHVPAEQFYGRPRNPDQAIRDYLTSLGR